jgi:hypothetical protein
MGLEMGSTNSPWRLSQVGMLPTVEDRDRWPPPRSGTASAFLPSPEFRIGARVQRVERSLDSPLIDSPIDRLSAPSRTGDGIRASGEFECCRPPGWACSPSGLLLNLRSSFGPSLPTVDAKRPALNKLRDVPSGSPSRINARLKTLTNRSSCSP